MKKVLIICGGLQFGGVERFAANIIKYAPVDKFQFDYLIFKGFGDALAPEIIEHGGRVITFPLPQQGYWHYIKKLGELIDKNRYDVVHSHTQFNSGINLWVAKKHGVPVRIAHSHTIAHEESISAKRHLYENAMRRMIKRHATHFCACGVEAGKWMYGSVPFIVIPNGIDSEKFLYNENSRHRIRKQYHLKPDAFVVGHSGTLIKLKNHEYLVRIFSEIRKIKKNAELVFVGTGSNEELCRLQQIAYECHVTECVHFVGAVLNVNEHLSAFDVFAFPSLREGTPLALLEAQANGVPCVISENIPADVILTDLVTQLPLSDKKMWVRAITEAQRNQPQKYVEVIKCSGYDARDSYQKLLHYTKRTINEGE